MELQEVVDLVRTLEGSLVLAPEEGSAFPEIAWGDFFFYRAPDGQVPQNQQPYATIVTKDYPDDARSDLDPPGRWRVNVHVDRDMFAALVGDRTDLPDEAYAEADAFLPHPVYGSLGWVSVVNPGERTGERVRELVRRAHEAAKARAERRASLG